MTNIKIETGSPACNAMKEELGGYTFAHGREGMAEAGEAMLAPCPFCGSTNPVASMYGENSLFKVECKNCGALVRGFDQCRQDAIDAWNTRASPAPDPVRMALAKIVGMAAKRKTDHDNCRCTVCEMRDVAEAALRAPPPVDNNPLGDAGCGDPSCKDPNCTYGKESVGNPLGLPNRETIARIIDPIPFEGVFDLPIRKAAAFQKADAILSLPEGEGWQAIETAPRGREIEARNANGDLFRVWWDDAAFKGFPVPGGIFCVPHLTEWRFPLPRPTSGGGADA